MIVGKRIDLHFLSRGPLRMIRGVLFFVSTFLLIFILYAINKPVALAITEPPADIYHVLNQEMLRENDYRYLLEMREKGLYPGRAVLREFEHYFQLVVNSFPDQADAYSMLGYCQYYLGKEEAAIGSFGSALKIEPAFVGYYYNLAVIAYHKQDYPLAIMLAKHALGLPIEPSIRHILSSKRVYMLIVSQLHDQDIVEYLKNSREEFYELLQIAMDHLGSKQRGRGFLLRLI